MGYCTVNELKDALGERELSALSNDDGTGTVDKAIVDAFIANASGVIDSYIGIRYALPLQRTHYILTRICLDITAYELYKRRGDASEGIRRTAYEDALLILEKIHAGTLLLNEATSQDISPSAKVVVTNTNAEQGRKGVFEDTMRDFQRVFR